MPSSAARTVDPAESAIDPELRLAEALLDAGRTLPNRGEHDEAVTRLTRALYAADAECAEAMREASIAVDRRARRVRGAITAYGAAVAGLDLPVLDRLRIQRALERACGLYGRELRERRDEAARR